MNSFFTSSASLGLYLFAKVSYFKTLSIIFLSSSLIASSWYFASLAVCWNGTDKVSLMLASAIPKYGISTLLKPTTIPVNYNNDKNNLETFFLL